MQMFRVKMAVHAPATGRAIPVFVQQGSMALIANMVRMALGF